MHTLSACGASPQLTSLPFPREFGKAQSYPKSNMTLERSTVAIEDWHGSRQTVRGKSIYRRGAERDF